MSKDKDLVDYFIVSKELGNGKVRRVPFKEEIITYYNLSEADTLNYYLDHDPVTLRVNTGELSELRSHTDNIPKAEGELFRQTQTKKPASRSKAKAKSKNQTTTSDTIQCCIHVHDMARVP